VDARLIIVYSITSFVIAFLFFPVLIKIFSFWKVFDSPGSHKIHDEIKPSMGGVPILMGVIFSILIGLPWIELIKLKYFLICLILMFITGLRDDILTLSPRQKLLSQLVPITILVVFGNLTLTSFYGLFFDLSFPEVVAILLTIFSVTILTNAYNLIDGIDGLAGSIGSVVLTFFGFWFMSTEQLTLSLFSFTFASATLAFLFFNWQPAKIFMGDTGALMIGLLLSFLVVQFMNQNYYLPFGHPSRFNSSIGTAACILIIPLFDTLRVIILRLSKLQSPFKADKNHLHHQFLKLGFSHQKTTLTLTAINLVFISLAFILRNYSDRLILPIIIVTCLIINQTLNIFLKKHVTKGEGSINSK
jgi:UDP-N-acetylmuramyl pentapeptide phosphotransferase/UDP-N-acetylglucosamine-1-phosphate transferase